MSKSKLNLAGLVSQAISFVLLFIPGMYYWERWEEISWGVHRLEYQRSASFSDVVSGDNILGYLIILIMLCNLVLHIISIFKDIPKKTEMAFPILSTATIIILILFSIMESIMDDYGYCTPVNWLFYVNMLFLGTTTILAFMRLSKKVKEEPTKKSASHTAFVSHADELSKYKELLDQGVITQEEFNAKKKQLLGL